MDQDQNQQPPTNQPNYDFIMKPGQQNGQPVVPNQQPKSGFHISKPLLFGGIAVVILLTVLTAVALLAKPETSQTPTNAQIDFATQFIKDVQAKDYDTSYSKLSSVVSTDKLTFSSDFVDRANEIIELEKCAFNSTIETGLQTSLVTYNCSEFIFELEVTTEKEEFKISNYILRENNENN